MEPQQYQELVQLLQRLLDSQTAHREKADQELTEARSTIRLLQTKLAHQEDIITMKDTLLAARDEMLDLLRGGFNRPN